MTENVVGAVGCDAVAVVPWLVVMVVVKKI